MIEFFVDEEDSNRRIDARFVIPWKARSSMDSIKREPLLSFCFTIRSIRPDYSRQPRIQTSPPDSLWLPPTDARAFKHYATTGPFQWHNGIVRPIPLDELHYWIRYSTTSLFWGADRQAFLHMPSDCTNVNGSEKLDHDLPLRWKGISFFRRLTPHNRLLSLLGYGGELNKLEAPASPAWMPELLPEAYQHQGSQQSALTAQLAGELSIIVGLAACSAPPDRVVETMKNSFRVAGPHWTPHGRVGQGRIHERGLVVDIAYDSRMGVNRQYLQNWEDGIYGPIIE